MYSTNTLGYQKVLNILLQGIMCIFSHPTHMHEQHIGSHHPIAHLLWTATETATGKLQQKEAYTPG